MLRASLASSFLLLTPIVAAAADVDSTDPTVDVQLFYPSPGGLGFFSVESGDVNPHLSVSSGLYVNYARKPLAVRIIRPDQSQEDVGAVVGQRTDIPIFAALGLFNIADIGVLLPLVSQGGLDGDALSAANVSVGVSELTGFTVGDLRVIPKVRFARLGEGLLSAALVGTVIVPTAGGAAYAGEKSVVYAPSLALSSNMGAFRVAANVGYRQRPRTKIAGTTLVVDDEVFYKLGAALDLGLGTGAPFEVVAELFGHTPAENGFGMGTKDDLRKEFQKARTSLELDVGIRALLLGSMMLSVGGGGGLQPGYGAPAPRVLLGLAYLSGEVAPLDTDGDRVPDDSDKCNGKKEDQDGFEDDDGCPDLDNDADNVLDEDDQCKMEAEDRDGFEDEEGCPEEDNDKDGMLDGQDACPVEAEDKDGFKDEDGCPEPDNDEDGIVDGVDKCAGEPEDKDGFNDSDGCPDGDNDQDGLADLGDLCPNHAEDKDQVADDDGCPEDNDADGIADEGDKCPNQAEVYNGVEDEDGCPEKLKVKSLVQVTEEKIEIKEKIFFATNSAKILPKSNNLMSQVAAVLKNYKHLTKIRIEGHTDSVGPRKKNLKLSQDRAESVRQYLIDHGIEPSRLEAVGYGPDKAIASNNTGKGREQNRRVEFVIVEQKPIGLDVSEGQEAPAIEMQLDMPLEAPGAGPGSEQPGAPAEQPPAEAPMFEVGPAAEEPPPAEEPKGKGKGKKKKKKKEEDEGGIEFNF